MRKAIVVALSILIGLERLGSLSNSSIPQFLSPDSLFKKTNTSVLSQKSDESLKDAIVGSFIFSFYSAALKDSDWNVRLGAAQSLSGLAQGIFPRLSSYFSAEPLDLAQEFLSRESLRQDSSLAVLLGISLLTQGYPETLSSPTQTWESVISLLPTLKEEKSSMLSFFSSLAQHALGRKGARMENERIAQAYQEYFREETLPKRRNEPKHLLGYILLDFELSRWNLPKVYCGSDPQIKTLSCLHRTFANFRGVK